MNTNFDFYNPTHILFGSGKLDELGNQPMPGKKALLLISSGKSAKVSGALERTQAQLEKAGGMERKIKLLALEKVKVEDYFIPKKGTAL